MTAVSRTLASLSPQARSAVEIYVEVAMEEQATPYFDDLARLGVLLTVLLAVGGTWSDVEDLIALHDDHLDEFLNRFHALTRWASLGGTFPHLVPEGLAA